MTDRAQPETLDRHCYFRLSESSYAALESIAQKEQRPVSFMVRRAIERFLESPDGTTV